MDRSGEIASRQPKWRNATTLPNFEMIDVFQRNQIFFLFLFSFVCFEFDIYIFLIFLFSLSIL